MKILPTLLTSLTLLTTLAPMAKADLASDYGNQQNEAQNKEQICNWMNSNSQFGHEDPEQIRYYIDENNRAWGTVIKYGRRCRSTYNFPINKVFLRRGVYGTQSKAQFKIEGNTLVQYLQGGNGQTTRNTWAYRL